MIKKALISIKKALISGLCQEDSNLHIRNSVADINTTKLL